VTEEAAASIGVVDRPLASEPRWPSVLAVLVALGLYVALPQEMRGDAGAAAAVHFAIPAVELVLLAPLALGAPHRHAAESAKRRRAAIVLTAVLSVANLFALGLLVARLADGSVAGRPLLLAAAEIWTTNAIVFALWYWEVDGGGPPVRLADPAGRRDFAFVQMLSPQLAEPGWHPRFVDYLYLSFTNASAFSPSDTLPLTRWAKLLMLLQSWVSIVTVVLVAARAVSMLG
jgi:uncharacterized membrane protein